MYQRLAMSFFSLVGVAQRLSGSFDARTKVTAMPDGLIREQKENRATPPPSRTPSRW